MNAIARRTDMIVWLTLALSLAITGDLVMDLAFEESALTTSVDASPVPEEPDNAAEHILMPSEKADGFTEIPWKNCVTAAVLAFLIADWLPSASISRAEPPHERPSRSSPIPLLLPLRI